MYFIVKYVNCQLNANYKVIYIASIGKTLNVSNLKPGDDHYMSYVGPPDQYDFMGATQFRLLCTIGLRASHTLLDFGCGSLRAGRIFINYLEKGCYFGIEPNKWLIEDAIENQIGRDLIELKNPTFNHNSSFLTDVFHQQFDYILAQSIFSHADIKIVKSCLNNFRKSLKTNGIVAATFIEGESDFNGRGWVYPGCVRYSKPTIKRLAKETGFFITPIPWYHPRQTWYLLAKNRHRLPDKTMMRCMNGAVFFNEEFSKSWKKDRIFIQSSKEYLNKILPKSIKNVLKKLLMSKSKNL